MPRPLADGATMTARFQGPNKVMRLFKVTLGFYPGTLGFYSGKEGPTPPPTIAIREAVGKASTVYELALVDYDPVLDVFNYRVVNQINEPAIQA